MSRSFDIVLVYHPPDFLTILELAAFRVVYSKTKTFEFGVEIWGEIFFSDTKLLNEENKI